MPDQPRGLLCKKPKTYILTEAWVGSINASKLPVEL